MSNLDFGEVFKFFPELVNGLIVTLVMTIIAMVIGTATGLILALLRMSSRRAVSIPTSLYIDFWRTTPLLIQIFWFFFVLPQLIGVDYDIFVAATVAIGLNTGAFLAEVFRAAIAAVPRGQWDAGHVLGLSTIKIFRIVILPQASKIVLPPYAATAMLTLKGTSIAALIGVLELTKVGQLILAKTFEPAPILIVLLVMYFVVIYPIGILAERLERRLRADERTAMA